MTTTQTIKEQHGALQKQWLEYVIGRGRHYLRYLPPRGKVDYVLVAKMTSIDKNEAQGLDPGELLNYPAPHLNLLISIGDLTLNYGIHRYLCKPGETYYLTDLGKCAIPPQQANGKLEREEFEFWYPKLLEELDLVAKPTATVVPVGRATWNFLQKQQKQSEFPYRLVGPILHWSPQLVAAAQMASTLFPSEWEEFQRTTSWKDLYKSTDEIFRDAGLSQHMDTVGQRIKKEFRKRDIHYMFTYKKQMPLLRPDS